MSLVGIFYTYTHICVTIVIEEELMNLIRVKVTQEELGRGEGNQDSCVKLKNKAQINISLLIGYKHLDLG